MGEGEEREECSTEVCPVWTEWGDWTPCTVSCGGGLQVITGFSLTTLNCKFITTCLHQVRARECVLPLERISGCQGEKEESRECNANVCPIWTEWTDWTECSATCGGGSRTKVGLLESKTILKLIVTRFGSAPCLRRGLQVARAKTR